MEFDEFDRDNDELVKDVPPSNQLKALLYKNATLQLRQRKTVCCQLFIPVLLVVVVGVIQIALTNVLENETDLYKPGQVKVDTDPWLVNFPRGTLDESNPMEWTLWTANEDASLDEAVGYLFEPPPEDPPNSDSGGLLGEIPQFLVRESTDDNTTIEHYRPVFDPYDTPEDLYYNLTSLKNLEIAEERAVGNNADCPDCPPASVVFYELEESQTNASIMYKVLFDTQLDFGNEANQERSITINMIDQAFLSSLKQKLIGPLGADPSITTYMRKMPYISQSLQLDVASLFALFMLPLGLSFLLPVFVYQVVNEKQEKLRAMMIMMGLQMRNYWAVNYLFNYLMYLVVVLLVFGVGLAFGLRIFTQSSPLILIISFVLWGFAMVSFGILFSSFFSSARTATIVSYLVVIASVILSNTLNFTSDFESLPNPILLFYAPFAFFRIIFVLGLNCSVGLCPGTDELGDQFLALWFFLLFDALAYLLVGLYLDAVFPSEWGVKRHPLFPFFALRDLLCGTNNATSEEESLLLGSGPSHSYMKINSSDSSGDESDGRQMFKDDPNVLKEEKVVRQYMRDMMEDADVVEYAGERSRLAAASHGGILLNRLRKVYPSGKVAVAGTDLAVPLGECFGLLGPNGAGKTSTISMLTGLFPPTSGTARVGGYDLAEELYKVHRVMGVCPQFDILWGNLTCEETLLFYARLKGVPSSEEKEHVAESLRSVGLENYADRRVKALSGGMRRRVSIAVSLSGHARVIFLDEPTTGLDPVTRRALWDTLLAMKSKDRCLILTTHSMEEAEVLCDRIGIMTLGRMRCLGTSLYLKNRYGSGYLLATQYSEGARDESLAFVQSICPSATIRDDFPGHMTLSFTRGDIALSSLFQSMAQNAKNHGIVDWGLTQTSLEDAFLAVADDGSPASDD
eukprot:CAMPEP_0119123880 /NCGR_PEP_ID=MMETSP1310-20130426/3669_1 /TAXON_ID=464262 /ORGANISM="Genus nov. species nov., Strain RCC2339" /LENGTH=910 /DNA_ID=CAMNT_0007113751 /DNA_START=377 /DNA_END=3109 /DNA_ORIENTATION=+